MNARTVTMKVLNSYDLFRKEKCPYCDVRMKKTWEKRILYGSETTKRIGYEKKPEFHCKKCNYKIEAQFHIKSRNL